MIAVNGNTAARRKKPDTLPVEMKSDRKEHSACAARTQTRASVSISCLTGSFQTSEGF